MMLPDKDYSDETARVIDEEIRKIVDEAYDECTRLIDTHWDQLVAVAEALLKYETLSSDDVDKLMKGERIEKPTVAELLSAEAAKTTPSARDRQAHRGARRRSPGHHALAGLITGATPQLKDERRTRPRHRRGRVLLHSATVGFTSYAGGHR